MNLSKPYPHYCATHAVYYGSPTDTIPATMCPLCGISQELKAQPAPRTYEVARALSWIDAVEQRGPVEEQKPEMWRVLTDEGIWYRGPGSNGPLVFTDYNKAYWEANRISGRVQALFASPVTAHVEPAPPVQEAVRDWLRTAFIKLAAYVAQRHHAEGCPTLAHPYERCTCGWDDMATNITRWNAQLNSPVAEPASLGAEDAAKEIFDLICDFNADKVEKISRTQLEAIIRKHQPIKAGDSGAEE